MSDPVPADPEDGASAAQAPAQPEPPVPPPAADPVTAGTLLRQARQARGLHIAALATSIKVAPRKLELLEADRFDELPDATFTRALAQTVCRTLKIDAAPVLALLPQPQAHRLDHLSQGLNAPFRDKPLGGVPTDLSFLKNPGVIGAVLLALAAAAIYLLPAGWIASNLPRVSEVASGSATAPAPAAADAGASEPSALMPPVLPPNTVVETVTLPAASAPGVAPGVAPAVAPVVVPAAPPAAPSASAVTASAPPVAAPRTTSGALLLKATAESWIEVIDGRGTVLVSRSLQPGESLGLDGASPLHVRIGNVSATTVTYRGRAVTMSPTRDNIAKFDLE